MSGQADSNEPLSDWLRLREAVETLSPLWGIHIALGEEGQLAEVRGKLGVRWGGEGFVFSLWDNANECFDENGMFVRDGTYRVAWGPTNQNIDDRRLIAEQLQHELEQAGFKVVRAADWVNVIGVGPAPLTPAEQQRNQLHQFQAAAAALGISPAALALERFAPECGARPAGVRS